MDGGPGALGDAVQLWRWLWPQVLALHHDDLLCKLQEQFHVRES